MTHHKVGIHTPAPQHREQRDFQREQRRLSELGAIEQATIRSPDNLAQWQSQMPIQFVGHRVECLDKRRQVVIQLPAHPDALRALPGNTTAVLPAGPARPVTTAGPGLPQAISVNPVMSA